MPHSTVLIKRFDPETKSSLVSELAILSPDPQNVMKPKSLQPEMPVLFTVTRANGRRVTRSCSTFALGGIPSEGVFLSRDTVESEPAYQYVRGNVVNLTDASGNSPDNCECPVNQPTYMHEKARISCLDLYMIGGANPMERYLEKESISDPAAFMTRVAVSERTDDLQDQKLVMWIIRYRVKVGFSKWYEGKAGGPVSTNLWTEVSEGGFEAFNIFRNLEEPEKIAKEKTAKSNVIAAIYPYNTELNDNGVSVNRWIIAFSAAQSILATDLKTGFPQDLIANKEEPKEDPNNDFKYAFDSFWGTGAPGGRYSKEIYPRGNDYFAYYPTLSHWIWPEWKPEQK